MVKPMFSGERMAKNISVNRLDITPIGLQNTEYVERKGIGHPDSMIDGIVDETSHQLCREYIDNFGVILHHNVDKGLIIGGESKAGFGHGEITRKIEVIVTGRATSEAGGKKIDVNQIAKEVTAKYIKGNTRFLDIEKEVIIESKIAKGSSDLAGVFERGRNDIPLANDTSFGIGFAPFSTTERLVLGTENFLNGREYKSRMPAAGEDIKVMGLRNGEKITLTIGIAFVSQFVESMDKYVDLKERIKRDVISNAQKITDKEIDVHINTGDSVEGADVYLTKSGLSWEAGDDGSVGRGNRVNGIITPFRHMSLEAAAGKNPVSHIGKIYNILSTEMAKSIANEYPQIQECDIAILSQIGRKISEPHHLNINLVVEEGADFDAIRGKADYIAAGYLEDIGKLTLDISLGKYKTF